MAHAAAHTAHRMSCLCPPPILAVVAFFLACCALLTLPRTLKNSEQAAQGFRELGDHAVHPSHYVLTPSEIAIGNSEHDRSYPCHTQVQVLADLGRQQAGWWRYYLPQGAMTLACCLAAAHQAHPAHQTC